MGLGTKEELCGNAGRLGAVVVVAGCALLSASAQMAKAEEISRQSFWNSREVVSFNLRPFWKWRAVLDRYAREMKGDGGRSCPSSRFGDCPYDEWRRFLSEIASNDRWGQLVAVNGFMNARRYMADEWNWGVKDYWATPGEFLARAGDCEDYAIAKYLSLKELGWAEGDLRLVVVRDAKLRVAHAVLVVAYGGRRWVLDNQTDRINETVDIRHYRPVFSINETSWWHHRASAPATALRTTDGSGSLNATPTAAEYHP